MSGLAENVNPVRYKLLSSTSNKDVFFMDTQSCSASGHCQLQSVQKIFIVALFFDLYTITFMLEVVVYIALLYYIWSPHVFLFTTDRS